MSINWKQIEADRAAGAPGPWDYREDGFGPYADLGTELPMLDLYSEPDLRRIARVPGLETYALEARAKLEAAEAMHEFMCHLWCEMKLPPDLEDKMDMVFSAWDAAQKGGGQ